MRARTWEHNNGNEETTRRSTAKEQEKEVSRMPTTTPSLRRFEQALLEAYRENPKDLQSAQLKFEEALSELKEAALEGVVTLYTEHETPAAAQSRPSCIVLFSRRESACAELRRLRSLAPGVPILLFLRSADDPALAKDALKEGAHGLLHSGMPLDQVSSALASVSQGKVVIPEEILRSLPTTEEHASREEAGPPPASLTPRQRQIVELVSSRGLSDAQVAKRLSLPERTVKQELHAAYRALRYSHRLREATLCWQSNHNNNNVWRLQDTREEDA